MTPQTARFLEKARKLLADGDIMLGVALYDAAGRTAYLTGFPCSPGPVFEQLAKVVKTHTGVQTEFLRLTKDQSVFDPQLRGFLSRAYNLKAVADYETGPGSGISGERASEAMRTAGTSLFLSKSC